MILPRSLLNTITMVERVYLGLMSSTWFAPSPSQLLWGYLSDAVTFIQMHKGKVGICHCATWLLDVLLVLFTNSDSDRTTSCHLTKAYAYTQGASQLARLTIQPSESCRLHRRSLQRLSTPTRDDCGQVCSISRASLRSSLSRTSWWLLICQSCSLEYSPASHQSECPPRL
jgi:hypothetical protein